MVVRAVTMVGCWRSHVSTLRVSDIYHVASVFSNGCSEINKITLCTCTSPALQLLSHGLFPCAPLEPSLAVDLNVLDFAKELFVNAAPNTTAWCETLEGFLSSRRFKLKTRVGFTTDFI